MNKKQYIIPSQQIIASRIQLLTVISNVESGDADLTYGGEGNPVEDQRVHDRPADIWGNSEIDF